MMPSSVDFFFLSFLFFVLPLQLNLNLTVRKKLNLNCAQVAVTECVRTHTALHDYGNHRLLWLSPGFQQVRFLQILFWPCLATGLLYVLSGLKTYQTLGVAVPAQEPATRLYHHYV